MKELEQALAGELPPGVALARLLLSGTHPTAIRAFLEAHPEGHALMPLLDQAEAAVLPLRALLATGEPGTLAEQQALFDRAAVLSPDAAVAAWSLGDPMRLHDATQDIIEWLEARGVLRRGAAALDLGCGTGRLAAALARRGMVALGIDLSSAMVAIARARHPHVAFATTEGEGLSWLRPRRFALILAADVFPYLHRAGLAARHVEQAAHLLAPGGALAILNLSYRDDREADRRDVRQWAQTAGLHVLVDGSRPFTAWDGLAFLLGKPASG